MYDELYMTVDVFVMVHAGLPALISVPTHWTLTGNNVMHNSQSQCLVAAAVQMLCLLYFLHWQYLT